MKQTKRKTSFSEKVKANKYFYLIVPVFLVLGLILYVLLNVELFPVAKYGGIAIATIAAFIFSKSFIDVKSDLLEGKTLVIEAQLLKKVMFFGGKSKKGSLSKGSKRTKTPSYIFKIGDDRYRVKKKHFIKVDEGDLIELTLLPKSKFILDVEKIEKLS